jgi:hypothetical protein
MRIAYKEVMGKIIDAHRRLRERNDQ